MKIKNIFLSALLVGASYGYSQDIPQTEVPSLVLNAFAQQFNNPNDVEWELQKEHYQVDFEMDRMDHEAWFDNSGKLLRQDEEIKKAALPAAVKTAIKENFDGYRADDVEKSQLEGKTTYKVELQTFTDEWSVVFGENGEVIEKRRD